MTKSKIGVLGLGVMGKSLALNIASRNINVSVYNRTVEGVEEGIVDEFVSQHQDSKVTGFNDLKAFIDSMEKPRQILIMIKAGKGIDQVIQQLLAFLEKGDIILDGGNSHYKDSQRRFELLNEKGISFIGLGVSGGEEGALKGPSLMPGGSVDGYSYVKGVLEQIAAKDNEGRPCCTYIGKGGSGHFVKMIHNGIEYAEMQFLAEIYALLSRANQLDNETIADLMENWKETSIDSYLLEITIDILRYKEGGDFLLDKILDAAEQKGTGGWSTSAALELGAPFSSISEAVMARLVSSKKAIRSEIGVRRAAKGKVNPENLRSAYKAVRVINHIIGFETIREASVSYQWDLNFSEVARIWTNGCIIRSKLMNELIFKLKGTPCLWSNKSIMNELYEAEKAMGEIIAIGAQSGISLPGFSSAFNHYLGMTTAKSTANLIQAQRDYFGAHTYQKIDQPLSNYYHTEWIKK